MSQSRPSAWMRKMSSVWRIGRSGIASTASDRAMVSSRETRSGGCQGISLGAIFIGRTSSCDSLFRQYQAGIGFGAKRNGAARREIGLAVEQALQVDLAAAYLSFDRRACEDCKQQMAV